LYQESIPNFQAHIQELLDGDIGEMYVNQIEKSVENEGNEDSGGSGLGYLTMLMDYDAALGWKFHNTPDDGDVTMVTTMVKLPL